MTDTSGKASSLSEDNATLGRRLAELEAELASARAAAALEIAARRRAELELQCTAHALTERRKELQCLYAIAKLNDTPGITLDGILRGTADILAAALRFPEAACARVLISGREHQTPNFAETRWHLTAPVVVNNAPVGRVEVGYLEDKWGDDHDPFLEEERTLLSAIAERAGRIVERLQAQEAIRRGDMRLEAALEHSHTGGWELDLTDGTALRTLGHDRIFGYATLQPSWSYGCLLEHVLPEDRARVENGFRMAIAAQARWSFDCRIRRADGEIRWIHVAGGREGEGTHPPRRLSGIVQDITERVQTEERLRETNRKLARAQRIAHIGSWEADLATGTVTWSEEMFRIFGLPPSPTVSLADVDKVFPKGELERFHKAVRATTDDGAPYSEDYRIVRPDGVTRFIHDEGEVVRDGQGKAILIVGATQDITEQRQAQEEAAKLETALFHAQKMEAIGTLAGGVAHDFNNILGGLLGGLSLLELELGDRADACPVDIQEMKDLVQRGADLAKQLLGFSRRGKYDVRPLSLALVLEKTSAMFGRTRRDITIRRDVAPDLRPVLMDYTQLEQVLLNLLLNAGQAMPGGGQLLLRAENAALTQQQMDIHGVAPGLFVKLVVADTGVGMNAATQARIFEPFFSTKAPGHGSGLGLASVYGVVKNHGGIISVESELSKGTAFTIYLPATDQPVDDKPAPKPVTRAAHGTILVVDDEELLLRLSARLLETLGYEVLTANGGEAAVEVVHQHHDRISLIILDLTMPGMSGAKTFDAVRAIAPTVKVLLASGFSFEGQAQELLARGCNGFIQKPFDLSTLSEKIQSLQ